MSADQGSPRFPADAISDHAPLAFRFIKEASAAGMRVWVVGGAVRDFFAGRGVVDLDLAIDSDPVPLAAGFAAREGLGFVVLDEKRRIARMVVKGEGGSSLDVGLLNGRSIEEDLRRRDFTINAVAARWTGKEFEIIDPMGGLRDLDEKRLRAASPDSIQDDPPRILRAYRFALSHGLAMTPEVTSQVREALPLLPAAPGERVSVELFHILRNDNSRSCVPRMAGDGVLDTLFPELAAGRGVSQNGWHHLDVFDHSIETFKNAELLVNDPPSFLAPWAGRIMDDLAREVSHGAPKLAVLKLAALLHDIGKPRDKTISENGATRFIGHDRTGERLVRAIASRLRLPGAARDGFAKLVREHLRPFNAVSDRGISRRAAYRFQRDLGGWALAGLLLALADASAARGPAVPQSRREREKEAVINVLELMDEMERSASKGKPPVNGHDLMTRFNLAPGRLLGRLLEKIAEAAALGEIESRDDAFILAARLMDEETGDR
ncbi:MAG: HD domain-containing protein [Candidatus Nitrospinota bacterium M3_3B_026]